MANYASPADLKTYLGISGTTDDVLLGDLLERASKYIEGECQRRFVAETETRYYELDAIDRDGLTLMLDQDLYSITTLTNGDTASTAILPTDYFLLPRNGGPPYYGIRLKTSVDTDWELDEDEWIEVTGKWGWSLTPPADIVQATIRLAAYYYHQKDASIYDVQAFPEAGVMTLPQGVPKDVEKLIALYKRRAG